MGAHHKAYYMLGVPQDEIDRKPLASLSWVFPSVNRTDIHDPRLPRLTRHHESFDVMSKTVDIERKLVEIVDILNAEVVSVIENHLCITCISGQIYLSA